MKNENNCCNSRWIVKSNCPMRDGLVTSCSYNCGNCEYDGHDDLAIFLGEEEYE